MDSAPVDWFTTVPARVRDARLGLADLLAVPRDSLALVPNASAGATTVYNSQPCQRGGDVLVTDHGYGAVTMGAERLATSWGGRLITAAVPLSATADEAAAAIIDAVTPQTRLIVLDHITSSTARALPAHAVALWARDHDIPILIDGAHVPGLYNEWIAAEPWSYWIGNFHKFACSPRGVAVLINNPNNPSAPLPLVDSWGAKSPFPSSFDIQGTLDITSYLCAQASWQLIQDTWGWDAVHRHMEAMGAYGVRTIAGAFEAITGNDHRVCVGQPVRALDLIRIPEGLIWDHASADALRDRFVRETGSEVAFTEFGGAGYLRLSAHAYTTAAHIDEFADRFVPLIAGWARRG